jgi:hypothetical protein
MKLLVLNLAFGLGICVPSYSEQILTEEARKEIIQVISTARAVSCSNIDDLIRSELNVSDQYYFLLSYQNTAMDTVQIQSLRVILRRELVRLANLHSYCKH